MNENEKENYHEDPEKNPFSILNQNEAFKKNIN